MIKEGPQRERVDREYIRERARERKKRRKVNDDYDAIRRKEKQNSLFARDTIEKETFFLRLASLSHKEIKRTLSTMKKLGSTYEERRRKKNFACD